MVIKNLQDSLKKDLTWDEVEAAFNVSYPDADRNIYQNLFKALRAIEISKEVADHILTHLNRSKALLRLSETVFRVKAGTEPFEKLQEQWELDFSEENIQEVLPLSIVSNNLEELINEIKSEQGHRWRLDCLNKSLGSLRRGDFGFIFARPETGKTTFLASEVSSFLSQSTEKIVWFNNEEQGHKVMLRMYQAFFGITMEQLMNNPKRYNSEFNERVSNRFHLFDSATIHKKDVERIVNDINPGIVIYDQIDKIKGFTSDREDLRLGAIYQWARELAKGAHAAIGVCQADGHAEGVRYLTMEHVSNAKTAKQAEADWIIGIGKIHDDGAENVRFFNICKNKLVGDPDSIPDLRHGKFEVLIDSQRAQYKDIVKYE